MSTPGHSPHNSMSDLHELEAISMVTEHQSDLHNGEHRPTFSVPVNIPRHKMSAGNTSLVERLSPENKPTVQHEIQLLKGKLAL